jgi:hypothetical protein
MKYAPIWVPLILILGLLVVKLYRPDLETDHGGPSGRALGAQHAK